MINPTSLQVPEVPSPSPPGNHSGGPSLNPEGQEGDLSEPANRKITAIADVLSDYLMKDFTKDVEGFAVPGSRGWSSADNYLVETVSEFDVFQRELHPSNLVFARSVSKIGVTIFSMKSRLIGFYSHALRSIHIDNLKFDHIVCMDYDEANFLFVFVFGNGKVQFAKWENNRMNWIDKPIDAFKQPPFEVKMIHGSWLILGTTKGAGDELLVRSLKPQIQFTRKTLKIAKSPIDSSGTLSSFVFRDAKAVAQKGDKNHVIVSFNGHNEVSFYSFSYLSDKSLFSASEDNTFRLIKQIRSPKLSKEDPAPANQASQPDRKSTVDVGSSGKTIVIFDKQTWSQESQMYVLIIWGDILQRFAIKNNFEFEENFALKFEFEVVHAYLGATELLVLLNDKYELITIDLFTSIESGAASPYLDHKYKMKGGPDVVIIPDMSRASLGVFLNNSIQLFTIKSWDRFITSLKLKDPIKAAYVISELISGKSFPLNGAISLSKTTSECSDFEVKQVEEFRDRVRMISADIVNDILDELQTRDDKAHLVELLIWLLIHSNNYELLFDRLLNTVLEKNELGDNKPLAQIFIEQLAAQMKNDMLQDSMSIFFTQVIHFEGLDEILMKFFFYLAYNFEISENVFSLLKMVAQQKNFALFFFFLLLNKPLDHNTLADITDMAKDGLDLVVFVHETSGIEVRRSDLCFCYIFDIFNGLKLFNISPKLIHIIESPENVSAIREVTQQWFFKITSGLLIRQDPMFSLFILCDMHRFYNSSSNLSGESSRDPSSDRNSKQSFDQEILIENCQSDFDQFFLQLISQKVSYEVIFVMLAFVHHFPSMSIRERLVPSIFNRILNPEFLKEWKESTVINPYRFFVIIFKFFFFHRSILIDSNFKQIIQPRKDEDEILLFIYNDLQGNIEQNFSYILSIPVFFELLHIALSDIKSVYAKKYIESFKKYARKVIEKDQNKFISIVSTFSSGDLSEITNLIEGDLKVQYRLLAKVANERGIEEFSPEMVMHYFGIICESHPDRIIDFLEKFNFDSVKAMQICEKFGRKRGMGYIAYRIGDTKRALNVYRDLIVEIWENSSSVDSDADDQELIQIFEEIKTFHSEEIKMIDMLLSFILFISRLTGKERLKNEIYQTLFSKLFNFHCDSLFAKINELQMLKGFLQDKNLVTNLLLGYRNQAELNKSINGLFNLEVTQLFDSLIDKLMVAFCMEKQPCVRCGLSDHSDIDPLYVHICGLAFHLSCQTNNEIQTFLCPMCGKQIVLETGFETPFVRSNELRLIQIGSDFAKNEEDKFQIARVFEQSVAIEEEYQAKCFEKAHQKKKGFRYLSIIVGHFDV